MHEHGMSSSFTCMFFNFFQQYFTVFHVYLFYIFGQIISKHFLDAIRNRISFLIFFGIFIVGVYSTTDLCVLILVLKICWIPLLLTIFFACILHCILFSINIHMQVKGYKSTHCIDSFLSVSFWYSHSFSRLTISYVTVPNIFLSYMSN